MNTPLPFSPRPSRPRVYPGNRSWFRHFPPTEFVARSQFGGSSTLLYAVLVGLALLLLAPYFGFGGYLFPTSTPTTSARDPSEHDHELDSDLTSSGQHNPVNRDVGPRRAAGRHDEPPADAGHTAATLQDIDELLGK